MVMKLFFAVLITGVINPTDKAIFQDKSGIS